MMTKTQTIIYEFLKNHPEGVVGAVRTNQLARGFSELNGIGSGQCLEPLYKLVAQGFVRTEVTGKTVFGKPVLRYFAV